VFGGNPPDAAPAADLKVLLAKIGGLALGKDFMTSWIVVSIQAVCDVG
jgi:hypothetical protein